MRRQLWVLSALSTALAPCATTAQVTHRPVALSGEAAPGTAATFRTFANPVINSAGDVAFQANLSGPTTDVVPHGAWSGTRGNLRTIAVAGGVAPGTGGARFRTVGWPIVLTDDGRTLFYGSLVNAGGVNFDNDYGIWTGAPGAMGLFSRRGDPAPGLSGADYSLFFANTHPSGAIGFNASLQGPAVNENNSSAAWVGTIGSGESLQLLARAGDAAPGLPAGARFRSVGTPMVSASGQVAMHAMASVGPANVEGVWVGPPGNLVPVVTTGTAPPDAPGRTLSFLGVSRFNDAGHLAFMGFLNAETTEEQISNVGIWAGPAGAVRAIALEDRQAPGFEEGVVFHGSVPGEAISYDAFKNPTLGNGGHVAFAATVFAANVDVFHNDGVWVSQPVGGPGPAALTLVAREGDAAPGAPDGTVFKGVLSGDDLIPAFENPLLNASGQVAFEALTSGPLGQFGRGVWVTDASGQLHLVAHSGMPFEVAPGDVRVVDLVKLSAGGSSADGQLAGLNDAGRLAFAASFTDGTEGVFVATVVPEPAGLWLASGLVLLMRRKVRAAGRRPNRQCSPD